VDAGEGVWLTCRASLNRSSHTRVVDAAIGWKSRSASGGALQGGDAERDPLGRAGAHDGRYRAQAARLRSAIGGDRGRGDFILTLLGAGGDATLAEMCAALAAKGRSFSTSALSRFFARRGITLKKVRARGRARAAGYPEASPGVVQNATRPQSGKARLHRRDLGLHEHLAKIWSRSSWRTSACGDPSRPLENNDIRGRTKTGKRRRSARLRRTGPINAQVFEAWVEQFLILTLRPADIVVGLRLLALDLRAMLYVLLCV
jgi:hypothetical protein